MFDLPPTRKVTDEAPPSLLATVASAGRHVAATRTDVDGRGWLIGGAVLDELRAEQRTWWRHQTACAGTATTVNWYFTGM